MPCYAKVRRTSRVDEHTCQVHSPTSTSYNLWKASACAKRPARRIARNRKIRPNLSNRANFKRSGPSKADS
eukprot:3087839-Amphidinium_carterae.1